MCRRPGFRMMLLHIGQKWQTNRTVFELIVKGNREIFPDHRQNFKAKVTGFAKIGNCKCIASLLNGRDALAEISRK